jgi:hypothetical protein
MSLNRKVIVPCGSVVDGRSTGWEGNASRSAVRSARAAWMNAARCVASSARQSASLSASWREGRRASASIF